jgi:hypothetical protein
MKSKAIFQVAFLSVCLLAFFVSANPSHAVSVQILSSPSTITQDMFTLTASISGAGNGTNYLRIDIYKEGTTSYFGQTNNGTDWYSGSDYHLYFPVTIAGSSWNGSLQGKLGSPTTSQYDGTGSYKLRLRRYTSGGSSSSPEADASSVIVAIAFPTPTPTPSPTLTPTHTPTSTSVPTTKPNTSPTLKPSLTPTLTPSPSVEITESNSTSDSGDVLGSSTSADTGIVAGMQEKKKSSLNIIAVSLILGGILILSSCGILFFYKWRKGREHNESTYE